MRDEHLDRYHQQEGPQRTLALDEPDNDEIQPLLFDLIKADEVEIVKTLLPRLDDVPYSVRGELGREAARSGSWAMLQLIAPLEISFGKI